MELGRAVPFLWVLCQQPESPCEGRKSWRIKEFLCSPEIISTASARGWREHNLLIPTLLKIDLVTGSFSFSQGNRCVIESLLLHQKCWRSVSSSAKILLPFHGQWASHAKELRTRLWMNCEILCDEDGLYKVEASLRHLWWNFLFLRKFFIPSSHDLSWVVSWNHGFRWSVLTTLISFKHKSLNRRENISIRFF